MNQIMAASGATINTVVQAAAPSHSIALEYGHRATTYALASTTAARKVHAIAAEDSTFHSVRQEIAACL